MKQEEDIVLQLEGTRVPGPSAPEKISVPHAAKAHGIGNFSLGPSGCSPEGFFSKMYILELNKGMLMSNDLLFLLSSFPPSPPSPLKSHFS